MIKELGLVGCLLFGGATAMLTPRAAQSTDLFECDKLYYGYNVTAGKGLLEQDALQMTFPIIDPNSDYDNYIRKVNGSTVQESKAFATSSIKELSSQYTQNIGADVMGNIYAVNVDLETQFDTTQHVNNIYSQYYEMYSTIISRYYYVVQLDVEQIKAFLAPKFRSELNAVHSTLDAKALFQRYGTHLNTGYTFGGRMDITNYKTTSDVTTDFSKSYSLKEKVSVAVGKIGAGESATIEENYATHERTNTSTSTYNFVSYGGVATSSLTLDGLFTYNESIIDGDKSGFMYTRWINSINNDTDLTIIGIPNGAQSIPLWNLLPNDNESAAKRNVLINAYKDICGDKYEEYQNKYKELVRSVDYSTQEEDGDFVIGSVYVKTPHNYFYKVELSDLFPGGDHEIVHNGDILYFNLDDTFNLGGNRVEFDVAGSSDSVKVISEKDMIYQVDGNFGNFTIKIRDAVHGEDPTTICQAKIYDEQDEFPFEGGAGTEMYPYIIDTPEQFMNISIYPDAYYLLVNDLDFDEVDFSPLGDFTGVLDGNYCEISNIHFDSADSREYLDYGIFCQNRGAIRDLKITNCGLESAEFDYKEDFEKTEFIDATLHSQNVGTLCGVNEGSISNILLTNSILRNSLNNLDENGDDSKYINGDLIATNVGSLAGLNSGDVENVLVSSSTLYSGINLNQKVLGKRADICVGGIVGRMEGGSLKSSVFDSGTNGSIYSLYKVGTSTQILYNYEYNLFNGGLAGYVASACTIENCFSRLVAQKALDSYARVDYEQEAWKDGNDKPHVLNNGLFVLNYLLESTASYANLYAEKLSSLTWVSSAVIKPVATTYGFSTSEKNDTSCYSRVNGVGNEITVDSSAKFNRISLNKTYFSYKSGEHSVAHLFEKNRKDFVDAYFDSENEAMQTSFYSEEMFSPNNINIKGYLKGDAEFDIHVFKLSLKKGTSDELLNQLIIDNESQYSYSISLYGNADNDIKVVSNAPIKVKENTLAEIYVDFPQDEVFEIEYDDKDSFVEEFDVTTFNLKGILTNGRMVDINEESTFIKNARTYLSNCDLEEGQNIICINYGNSLTHLSCDFKINVVKRDVKAIEITKEPDVKEYAVGSRVDLSGLEVTVSYEESDETRVFSGNQLSRFDVTGDIVGQGTNTVIISCDYAEFDSFEVEGVYDPETVVESITLSATETTISVGERLVITATLNGGVTEGKIITWSSTNTNVLTVTNGVVEAIAPGTAIVNVGCEDKVAYCRVTVISGSVEPVPTPVVTKELSSITLSGNYQTSFMVGSEFEFGGRAVIYYTDNTCRNVDPFIDISNVNMNVAGTYNVIISYAENGKTVSASYKINVYNATASKGCGGSIEATSIILGCLSIAGVTLILLRKKKHSK